MSITLIHTDVRNDKGQSLLDLALERKHKVWDCDDHNDVALYLINHGCGGDEDKDRLLCRACEWGRLDVVKELVEEHHCDPKGKS